MPDDPADPVVPAACVFYCRRAMGEAVTRHSLRPLEFARGRTIGKARALARAENADMHLLFDDLESK
jgi:hypothetical protein